jgi:hypothetical protein
MLQRHSPLLLVLALFLPGLMKAQTPAPTPADEFTIVALPDTQFYSSLNPQIFAAQTQWIADHAQDQNIQLVVGLGDIVDSGGDSTQWQNADAALQRS